MALAAELAGRVAAEPGFTLAAPPSLALVCLRRDTGDPEADDRATRALLETVNASGRAFLSHTVVDGRYAIRVAIGGVTTGREHVDALWDLLRSTAADLGDRAHTSPDERLSDHTPTRSSVRSVSTSSSAAGMSSVRRSCAPSARVAS